MSSISPEQLSSNPEQKELIETIKIKTSIQIQLENLKQEVHRTEILNKLSEKTEAIRNLQLKPSQILMLESIIPGSLAKIYLKDGIVNFGNNELADATIGAGHIYANDRDANFITIQDNNGQIRTGRRRIYNKKGANGQTVRRIGYFDINDNKYLVIHEDYKIIGTYPNLKSEHTQGSTRLSENNQQQAKSSASITTTPHPMDTKVEADSFEDYTHNPDIIASMLNAEATEMKKEENMLEAINSFGQTGEIKNPALNQVLTILNIPFNPSDSNINSLKNNIADKLKNLDNNKFNEIYHILGRIGIIRFIRALRVETESISRTNIKNIVNDINTEDLNNIFGNKDKLTNWLTALATHESGLKIFSLSSTGCAGPFQFTWHNSQHNIQIGAPFNPFNPKSATEAVIKLMQENLKGLSHYSGDELIKRIILAHNHGAEVASTANIAQIKGTHGNPDGERFYNLVSGRLVDVQRERDAPL